MRTFNHLKDRHFPGGYPDWILNNIENLVQWYLNRISERFDLSEIKTIFDVGSLNGIESVKFTEKLDCQVYTFEPNPISLKTVQLSTEGIDNIHVNDSAVSDFNGTSKFYITHGNMGASSLLKPNKNWQWGSSMNEIQVNVIRLDDWCENNNIDKIDVLWMDVQGSEMSVFKGMGDLLNDVKAIYVECSMIPYYDGCSNKDEVIKYLSKYNFELVSETHHTIYEGDFTFLKKINEVSEKSKYPNPQGKEYVV